MAAVAVSTDLSSGLVVDASAATAFVEPVGTGSVSGDDYADIKSLQDESDVYIQGIASVSGAYTTNAAQRGCAVTDSGVGGVSLPPDGAIMVWQWWISPSALDVYANAGMFVAIGSAQSDLEIFPVSGNNLDPAPLGGWYCYPVDPRAATAYETVGTPDSVTFRWIGGGIDAPKQARGLTHYAIDAIRFGRCTSVITGGDGADPDATFLDISDELQNGAEAGGGLVSYGTFDNIFGAFYMQGLLQMGITGTNPCVFTDSNKVINIRNTPAVGANFNRWEIQNASSIITLTGCSFNNIGVGNSVAPTASKGDLSVVDSAATVNLTTCSFSDWGTFSWGSGTTLDGVAFRRCGTVTLNTASLVNCVFDKPDVTGGSAVIAVPTDSIDSCSFTRDTTKIQHAIDLGTVNTTTFSWNSTATDYAANDGPTGNEVIRVTVNPGQVLTINYSGTAPSVKNDGTGTITKSSSVSFDLLNLVAGSTIYVEARSGGTLTAGDIMVSAQIVAGTSFSTTLVGGQPFRLVVANASGSPVYVPEIIDDTTGTGFSRTFDQQLDE